MSASKSRLTLQEKARRWDELIGCLGRPGLRDTYTWYLTGMRRAVCLLLSDDALPSSLAAELKAHKVKLDALYLESIDGVSAVEGVLNLIPTYVTESITAEICQHDASE